MSKFKWEGEIGRRGLACMQGKENMGRKREEEAERCGVGVSEGKGVTFRQRQKKENRRYWEKLQGKGKKR